VHACLASSTVADPPDFRKYARNRIRSLAASLLAMSRHPFGCVCPDVTSLQQVKLLITLFLAQIRNFVSRIRFEHCDQYIFLEVTIAFWANGKIHFIQLLFGPMFT
jgi:hypothetical protein